MVQNKKMGGALTLVAGLLSLGVTGTASALPEVDVGTMPPIVATQSMDTLDSAVAAPEEVDEQDSAS